MTFESTDSGQDLVVCEDADDMFKRLGLMKVKDHAFFGMIVTIKP